MRGPDEDHSVSHVHISIGFILRSHTFPTGAMWWSPHDSISSIMQHGQSTIHQLRQFDSISNSLRVPTHVALRSLMDCA